MFLRATFFLGFYALLVSALGSVTPTDTLVFGDAASERAHAFTGENTRHERGALSEPVRVSLPKEPVDYYGGDLTFEMKVDPLRQNYFTVKFWGSDLNGGQKALLYLNGEQVGYRHMGDYEALNHGATEPSFKDRFFYYTAVLPLPLTRGRDRVTISIRTIGPISGYQLGGGYDGYQKKMDRPSRGYYRAYTHTSPALDGLENEKQGVPLPVPSVRPVQPVQPEPDPQAFEKSERDRFQKRLAASGQLGPHEIADLSRLVRRFWPELTERERKKAVDRLVAQIDAQAANAYTPEFFAKGVYQGDWGGSFQSVAAAVIEMEKFLPPGEWPSLLEEKITVKGELQTRRAAWTRMLKGNFDYARTHVARITNQAMFCLHGAYRSNRALQIVNPAVAEPEETAKRFIFEAAGIWPYRGNDLLDADGRLVGREDPFGQNYLQITEKGLTREFTYVGIYGEVANEVAEYWELYGYDELLKKALETSHARARMRAPDLDEDGYRAMRMEGVIESRGPAYPDNVAYGVRWNGGNGMAMARLKRLMEEHPEKYQGPEWKLYWQMAEEAVGFAQQMLADQQYLNSIKPGRDLTDYLYVKGHPPVATLLPNTRLAWYSEAEKASFKKAGFQPRDRYAWADEDNGVVVLRDGDLLLYAGLVMKAGKGLNGIARIHCTTPTMDRLATVVPDIQYEWGGTWAVRPDWTNVQFMNANNPPEGPLQALAGEILPVAVRPGAVVQTEMENPYAGYANFYSLRYLDYLIGMNTTREAYGNARSYTLRLPVDFTAERVFDFVSGKELAVKDGAVEVGPQSTVVLKMPGPTDSAPLPQAPRLAAAFAGDGGVTVRWLHADGAAAYVIKRAAGKDGPWREIGRVEDGRNVFFDPETLPGTTAFYTVAGINASGAGLDSPVTSLMPLSKELLGWFDKGPVDPAQPPGPVRELHGEAIGDRVDLSWKIAPRARTYDILRAEEGSGQFRTVATGLTGVRWSDTKLPFGKTYAYSVIGRDASGVAGPKVEPVIFSLVDDAVPEPWRGWDIGEVGVKGSDGWRDGAFTVRGGGADVWGNRDALRFLAQPATGDATWIVRVADQQKTDNWAKSGLMVRSSEDPGAANVFLFTTPGWGIVLQHRAEDGGPTLKTTKPVDAAANRWLKLVRKGDDFTGFASPDGSAWTEVGSVKASLPARTFAGLAVSSHSRGAINRTLFDHFDFHRRP